MEKPVLVEKGLELVSRCKRYEMCRREFASS